MEIKASQFNEKFIKNYDKNSNKEHIFEVDIEYLKNLHDLHNDLLFLPERMKIKKRKKLVCNLHVVHIRTCCTHKNKR